MGSMACDELFSELPYDISQKILSCLTLKQRAISSVVSKNWHHIITSLYDHKFVQIHHINRYCYRTNIPFCINCCVPHPVITKHAADNTTLLELYLFIPSCSVSFIFPSVIFESKLLTVLHLKGCPVTDGAIFPDLPSLKEICFDSVRISPTTFANFLNKCSSIVELAVIECVCLYFIPVPHLNQLKKVHVKCGKKYINKIEVKARNLMEFHLFASSKSLEVDLCACTKLQVLKIDSEYIPFRLFQEIFTAFPRLKSLFLRLCRGLNEFRLLSRELESLTLIDMVDLDDAIIVTPNLRSLKLIDMENVPSCSPVVGSRLMEAEIGLKRSILQWFVPANRLRGLRTFTENLGEKLTFSLATDTDELKAVLFDLGNQGSIDIQPLRIKHINLEIHFSRVPRYKSLIDELFSYFRPQTLLVRVNPKALKQNFIQVLLDELKGREKCGMQWCYFLEDFKILESTPRQGVHQIISLEFQWYSLTYVDDHITV